MNVENGSKNLSLFILFFCFLLLFGIIYATSDVVERVDKNNYCNEIYPSEYKYRYYSDHYSTMEIGYVRCCRYYFDKTHERKIECEVFKYERE